LALSNKCYFCSASAPFYQQLLRERSKARLVAILPQSVAESQSYLEHLNVTVDQVQQAPLTSLGITGTPTLILVDANGRIVKSWVGKLSPDREADVIASLE
jgi:thioredoxin-related protein